MRIPIKEQLPSLVEPKIAQGEEENPPLFKKERFDIWEKVAKFTIYSLVFLLPLWFSSWTVNILDFNKQVLLGALTFICLSVWLIKALIQGKIEFNISSLNVPVLFLVLAYGLSTIFSLHRYGSFWGRPLNISSSFLTLIWLVIFYILIINIFKKEEVFRLLFVVSASGFFVSLFGILQLLGKFFLPWDFSKITSFNTIGTPTSFSIFLACILPLTISLTLLAKKITRFILFLFLLTILTALLLVNFWIAWLILIVGSATLFVFSSFIVKSSGKNWWIFLPMIVLIVGLIFLIFRFSLGKPVVPLEVNLSQGAELGIVKKAISKDPILGTGPGTFIYNFSKYKSPDLNETLFWNVRFENGASEILDKIITTGTLGIAALLGLFFVFFWLGFKYFKNSLVNNNYKELLTGLGIFSGFLGLVLAQFLYALNLSLFFLFWFFIGSLALLTSKTKTWTFGPASSLGIATSFVLVLIIIFEASAIFIGAQKYLAEANYFEGLKAWQKGDSQQAINHLTKAIRTNPNLDIYFRDISQLYLLRAQEILRDTALSSDNKVSQAQMFITGAINSAKQATDLNPENVANWTVRGFLYRNTLGLLAGADDWALKSYEEAAKLEPTNPYIFTETGLVYLAKVDILKEEGKIAENLTKAKEKFQESLILKADYAPAHFHLAMISVREGKIKEAIGKLEETKIIAPFDAGLAFQIGILYYNDKQFEKAQGELERALNLDENYSNARYFLGLIYDRQGKRYLAIEQFEKIEKFNPENEEVKKILANLKAGKPALEGVIPAQPPIEQKPPERLER